MAVFRAQGDPLRVDDAQQDIKMRGELRGLMDGGLANVSSVAGAQMAYTAKRYCTTIVLQYRIKLVGWPDDIVFDDLSRIAGGERISRLLALWKSGSMHFVPLTDPAELDAAKKDPLLVAPARLHRGVAL
ncbi:uncharacterized protein TRAVEDRAFT_54838 [Trametes versicolor FP-101664 SS1]|uniref:Uncharacterized protein n=1 Tax=Trametes versicolor (strain FP-101664) TaxID=717944 RepID=R7S626_TRAVS|nr:uncharacterized protein TRAVEDRAFT_54838 [Trametes versicolor FP-101664 SS1]EIW51156.1 hypothetical protein TRAVEDRAFT_54838 [Trametes versicolor FP-101664 SS1]